MNKEVYENNVLSYEKKYGKYEIIEKNKYEDKIEICKNGSITLKIDKDERSVYLHSKYNPIKEAEKYYKNYPKINYGSVIFMFGFGLSYYVEELYNQVKERGRIVVFEPDKEIFDIAMKNIDMCHILGNKDISIAFSIDSMFSLVNLDNCDYRIESVFLYKEIYFDTYKEFAKKIKEVLRNIKMNFHTRHAYKYIWLKSTFSNFSYFLNSYKLFDFENMFKDKPIIVVGAGPSLNKNIHLLKELKGKVCIISVFSAAKVLEKEGIVPDFIATIDSLQYGITDFEANIPLIYTKYCNNELLKKHNSNKILSITLNEFLKFVLKDIEEDGVSVGPTVTYFCTTVATYFGASQIILIGQDFSWTKDNIHAKGSVHDKNLYDYKEYHHYNMPVEDMYGNTVYSNEPFMYFREIFENYAKDLPQNVRIIQASEGGLKIPGVETRTLRECIDIYCKDKYCDIQKIINNKFKESNIICNDKEEAFKKVREVYYDLCEIKEFTKESVELVKKILNNVKYPISGFNKNNNLIKRLDEIDEKIRGNKIMVSLIEPYITDITEYYVIDEVEDENINFALMNEKIYTTIDEVLGNLIKIIKEEMGYEN
ncbi:6-hydroxymethylpterin diphosphokinase MptE-like protein [uncultured Tyzzerella sp.]|uniref:motility associated factor glycosyltransferase family protein n=1 Tax=uncultured Tyzzerella sp. TaxID=2321398 RepID=UPI0029438F6C|nr:6-hydroxymethylpterin diphosphokinase MptE-like protein [uncultured Tyzzerella sp.]